MFDDATIAAIATPPGKSALAIVRVSGNQALNLLQSIYVPTDKTRREIVPYKPHLGFVFEDAQANIIDEVVVTYFQKPHSYTGEDLAEISCHGSPVVTRKILELLIRNGARLATPGEFTLRAFLNGKMDLTQAEAVHDLIESKTLYQARLATQQLAGSLSAQLQPVKSALIDIACHLESTVEFVEEDLETAERDVIIQKLDAIIDQLAYAERGFEYGRIVHDGFDLAIVGRPNVGKSSLFNSLLYEDRAIVTEIPGTTRDTLAESVSICGIPTRLIDTAGVRRDTSDRIEKAGIERTVSMMANSDVVLFVIDSSEPLQPDDYDLQERLSRSNSNYLVVLNKVDLPFKLTSDELGHLVDHKKVVHVSAKEHTGIEDLKRMIFELIAPNGAIEREDPIITNIRHKDCIRRTIEHLRKAQAALHEGLSEEFALYDLHKGHKALGEITGETTVEDILARIFSTFCIGK